MMELTIQDGPYSSIADELNRRGFRTREGVRWTPVSVFQMLPRLIEVGPEDLQQRRVAADAREKCGCDRVGTGLSRGHPELTGSAVQLSKLFRRYGTVCQRRSGGSVASIRHAAARYPYRAAKRSQITSGFSSSWQHSVPRLRRDDTLRDVAFALSGCLPVFSIRVDPRQSAASPPSICRPSRAADKLKCLPTNLGFIL